MLLHDYAVRMGNFANAFMLSGITTRMTQALQINLEYNTDILCHDTEEGLSVTEKESRRRLMWSCYIMDALVGSGVDQLTLMEERDIKIQLPCNERNFIQQVPCLTETLAPGSWLKILPGHVETDTLLPNMGIMAYFIRHISIRKRVLRYVPARISCPVVCLRKLTEEQIYQAPGECNGALGPQIGVLGLRFRVQTVVFLTASQSTIFTRGDLHSQRYVTVGCSLCTTLCTLPNYLRLVPTRGASSLQAPSGL